MHIEPLNTIIRQTRKSIRSISRSIAIKKSIVSPIPRCIYNFGICLPKPNKLLYLPSAVNVFILKVISFECRETSEIFSHFYCSGIESSFVETISLNQSWQVEDDLGWKFDEAVARHLTEWILKKLAKSASIVEGTEQLSLCDSSESSPVNPCSLHQGQVNQSLVVPASIDEPVKKVSEYLI